MSQSRPLHAARSPTGLHMLRSRVLTSRMTQDMWIHTLYPAGAFRTHEKPEMVSYLPQVRMAATGYRSMPECPFPLLAPIAGWDSCSRRVGLTPRSALVPPQA